VVFGELVVSEAVEKIPPLADHQLFFLLSSLNSALDNQHHYSLSKMAPQLKRRKPNPKVAEVNFDNDARHEFLTGFSKRKKQRAKHAQEIAEKRAREERIQDRKKVCYYVWFSGLPAY
jgi:hypothetical protein